jgi:hypothetical protein
MTVVRRYIRADQPAQFNSGLVLCPGNTSMLLVGCDLTARNGQRFQITADEAEITVGGDAGPFGHAQGEVTLHLPYRESGYADLGLENDLGLSLLGLEGYVEGYVLLVFVPGPPVPPEP